MLTTQTRVLTKNVPKACTSRVNFKPCFTQRMIYMRNGVHTIRKNNVVTKMSVTDIEYTSYLVGKSIILFTMFYCTLNWWHYRRLNKELEEKENDKKEK